MENISRRIEDKSKAEFVKERGLGTPATRAAVIEKLLQKRRRADGSEWSFLERKGKNICSTEFGRSVISRLPETIKSVELSADMEEKLADIERGKASPQAVLCEFETWIKSQIGTQNNDEKIGVCPKCGGGVFAIDNPKMQAFKCENKACDFILWKKQYGKVLTENNAKLLLKNHKTPLINGFISKAGKEYSAFLTFRDDFSVGMEFEKK